MAHWTFACARAEPHEDLTWTGDVSMLQSSRGALVRRMERFGLQHKGQAAGLALCGCSSSFLLERDAAAQADGATVVDALLRVALVLQTEVRVRDVLGR